MPRMLSDCRRLCFKPAAAAFFGFAPWQEDRFLATYMLIDLDMFNELPSPKSNFLPTPLISRPDIQLKMDKAFVVRVCKQGSLAGPRLDLTNQEQEGFFSPGPLKLSAIGSVTGRLFPREHASA